MILGAGTAGTIMANLLSVELTKEWSITVADPMKDHIYQPGLLFIPFGKYSRRDVIKKRSRTLPRRVDLIESGVKSLNPVEKRVEFDDGSEISYDILIIATGTRIAPEEIPGMADEGWYRDIFDFYTLEGALALHDRLRTFDSGRLVVHITEMPIKCPVAPLEFSLLADEYLKKRGIRDNVDLVYVTPLDSAFTKPAVASEMEHLFTEKGIEMVTEFNVEQIDHEGRRMISYDGRIVEYDVLVTTPTNKGEDFIGEAGIGDDLDFVLADRFTLRSTQHDEIWAIGDAGNYPTSKAGSVAHFQSEVLIENILSVIEGQLPEARSDGRAQCFIEVGDGRAMLIEFDYERQPAPGSFPLQNLGPMKMLKATRANHWGKMLFKWVYWHLLLKGTSLPIPRDVHEMVEQIEPSNEDSTLQSTSTHASWANELEIE